MDVLQYVLLSIGILNALLIVYLISSRYMFKDNPKMVEQMLYYVFSENIDYHVFQYLGDDIASSTGRDVKGNMYIFTVDMFKNDPSFLARHIGYCLFLMQQPKEAYASVDGFGDEDEISNVVGSAVYAAYNGAFFEPISLFIHTVVRMEVNSLFIIRNILLPSGKYHKLYFASRKYMKRKIAELKEDHVLFAKFVAENMRRTNFDTTSELYVSDGKLFVKGEKV